MNILKNTTLIISSLLICFPLLSQEFQAGQPVSAIDESGKRVFKSNNVKVYGSFYFAESCTFDSDRNLILAMNSGQFRDNGPNDAYVSLLYPDGSVHTPKWIGATRDGLELNDPLGSAISDGKLYTVDIDYLRVFDLKTGNPLNSIQVPGSSGMNGIAVTNDGTVYASNTRNPEVVFKISPDGSSSVFSKHESLSLPNGVAIDNDGNIVVVNMGDNKVITFNRDGGVVKTDYADESGGDGIVIMKDGTKYVTSVRHGSVSKIDENGNVSVIARGIPNAASMCYDSIQNQLVIPMNSNYALGFIKL